MKEYTEVQLRAKGEGIKGWHVKGDATLLAELESGSTPAPEAEKPASAKDAIDLIDLMNGITWDRAFMAIKLNGKKSKFWEHRELIKSKLNGD